jgi:heat shock protein HslJ
MQRIRPFEIIGAIVILSLTAFAGISCVKAANAEKLIGVTWVLKSYGDPDNLTAAVPDKDVTLTFNEDEKEVKGNGGVNAYGGDYETNGSKLTVPSLYQTMIMGTEPLRSQEVTYFKILGSAQSFDIIDQELTITGTEGILVFMQK